MDRDDPRDLWQTTLTTMREASQRQPLMPPTSWPSASPISARPHWFGAVIRASRSATPSSGRIATRPISVRVWSRTVARRYRRADRTIARSLFLATKICWLLDIFHGAHARAEKGELAFGTVDTYLLWRLTRGSVHATDATNASRTLLFNIQSAAWDEELLRLFNVPPSLLPAVRDTAGELGIAAAEHLGSEVPIPRHCR